MTKTTLTERIKTFGNSQEDWYDWDEDKYVRVVQDFIETEIALAREEGRQEMKEKCLNLLEEDDYPASPENKRKHLILTIKNL